MSWIKWNAHNAELGTAVKNTTRRDQREFLVEEINSKINYPSYKTFAKLSDIERGTVSTSLSPRFKEYQVSIDRRTSEGFPKPRPETTSERPKAQNWQNRSNRPTAIRTVGPRRVHSIRVHENAWVVGNISNNTPLGNLSRVKYAKSDLSRSLDRERDIKNRRTSNRRRCSKLQTTVDMGMFEDDSHCGLCDSDIGHDILDKLSDENMRRASVTAASDCEVCRRLRAGGNVDDSIGRTNSYSAGEISYDNIDAVNSECNENCEHCCESTPDGDMFPIKRKNSTCREAQYFEEDIHRINRKFHYRNEKSIMSQKENQHHSPFRSLNKYFSRKYRKFRKRFRSSSLPPCRQTSVNSMPDSYDKFDCNMNDKCSICERLERENDSDSQWEDLLACSCKSKSLLDVDKLSLFVNPTPSPRNRRRSHSTCECCQEIHSPLLIEDSVTDEIWLENSSVMEECGNQYDSVCESPYCEECAKEAENYQSCLQIYDANFISQNDSQELVYGDILTLSDLKKYGAMTPVKFMKRQPKLSSSKRKHKRRKRRKVEDISRSTMAERWIDTFALCFQCVLPKHGMGSSDSGGSGSDCDGDDEEGEPEEEYEEHGDAVSDDDDSDGGDSGSGSADEESMNSAELFDDTVNALEAKDVNNIEGSDDGGEPGSECTDSLTELGSGESEDDSDSSEDDMDSLLEAGMGGSAGETSLQSIIIYERE